MKMQRMQRIKVKGSAGYRSTPAEYIRDMLRYDQGKIEAIWTKETPHNLLGFTAIVQLAEYTPERWRSFMLVTEVLGDVGPDSPQTYTVDEFNELEGPR